MRTEKTSSSEKGRGRGAATMGCVAWLERRRWSGEACVLELGEEEAMGEAGGEGSSCEAGRVSSCDDPGEEWMTILEETGGVWTVGSSISSGAEAQNRQVKGVRRAALWHANFAQETEWTKPRQRRHWIVSFRPSSFLQ